MCVSNALPPGAAARVEAVNADGRTRLFEGAAGAVILDTTGLKPHRFDAAAVLQQYPASAYSSPAAAVAAVLGETEDVWHEAFRKMGRTYQAPTLVLFSGAVESACGIAATGWASVKVKAYRLNRD